MKLTPKQIIILAGGVLVVVVFFAALSLGSRSPAQSAKVALTVWGTDSKNVFADMGAAYTAASPNVTINYTQIDSADYNDTLLKAFAAGDGPDVFELGNRELPQWESVAAPIPASLATAFNTDTLTTDFPSVVQQDFVARDSIYALPLDLDTLAMYYNEDLFNTAGIVYPPKTWDDFEADVAKLRVLNAQGQITQAGAAIGGSETSIANAPDLVFLLMMQNGATMTDSEDRSATFDNGTQNGTNPGVAAFNFYLQFANSASPYYTWNDSMGDAVQSFIAGKTAMLFDYASAAAEIKQKAPFLNFGIAPMPQPASATIAINYPKYEGLAVSRQGQVTAAWQFIIYMTTNSAAEEVYSKDTGELPPTKNYIAANLNDPTFGTFAAQALTARSWYEADESQIDGIMNTAIQNVLDGSMSSGNSLSAAQDSVSTIMLQS